jgi:hypothetical protein
MEAIAITTQYDIESRKKMVKKLAGIPERPKNPEAPATKK